MANMAVWRTLHPIALSDIQMYDMPVAQLAGPPRDPTKIRQRLDLEGETNARSAFYHGHARAGLFGRP
jgi:hypothetical protein